MKKSILLLHGALGAKSQLHELSNRLSKSYDVHLFNFSGHGGEPFEENFNVPQFSAELKTYIDSFHNKKFGVFGYSMGGYVALYLESNHPGTFSAIFTLATKFDWNTESSAKEASMLNPEKLQEKVPSFALQLEKRHAPNDWKTLLQHTANMMIEMGENPPLKTEDFNSIKIPMMIGHGDLDKMVSAKETKQVVKALPNGFFKSYSDWPHPIEKAEIELLAADVEYFLG
jgi:pimeloyl-ACP methyl ester carboxylesterase